MSDRNEPLGELLSTCTYDEFAQALQLDPSDSTALIGHVRTGDRAFARAVIEATLRLGAGELTEDETLMLFTVREVCYAHIALLELCSDEQPLSVDPRRLYAYADDDLFFIIDYARAVTVEVPKAGPLPAIRATRRQVATVAASALAALTARGFDPPPTTDLGAERLFGVHLMNDVLAADDIAEVLDNIHDLVPYAAQCAAPIFAELYVPGHARYRPEDASTILAALMQACEDPIERDPSSVDEDAG